MTSTIRAAVRWQGRDDGVGDGHSRWHSEIAAPSPAQELAADVALVGFCSDEGVRRNHGRPGAADGPAAIRAGLAQLAAPRGSDGAVLTLADTGDVVVIDRDLEGGQELLGEVVRRILDHDALAVVLGGGHEVAYGTYLGVASCRRAADGARHGVFNVDAHFDLRQSEQATSGTPFLQMFNRQRELHRDLHYAVAGISLANNTRVLFDTAGRLGVDVLLDDECTAMACADFVDAFLRQVDLVHLSVDLDVLPAAVAPGVSAPAGFGVELSLVRQICKSIARSGKLAVVEVAELNPRFDIDNRTARLAARLIDEVVRASRS